MQERSVTLQALLDAREARSARQQALIRAYGKTLLSFTLNIPGPVKYTEPIERAFDHGDGLIRARFEPCYAQSRRAATGCEALYIIDQDAPSVKRIAVSLEENEPLGRLFDLDVLDADGRRVDREALGLPARKCLLCDADAHACARSRAHSPAELWNKVVSLLDTADPETVDARIAGRASRALLTEVCITPKPGLVDRANNGAHGDMDLFSFIDSASALAPCFQACACLGRLYAQAPPEALFERLRQTGSRALKTMLAATHGVNTHKGAIYSMGALCAAAGALGEGASVEALCAFCARLTRTSAAQFFEASDKNSARRANDGEDTDASQTVGERLYALYGLRGVRGQVADGFPSVLNTGLPRLKEGLERGLSLNDAAAATLLHLIARVDDTCLIGRSDLSTGRRVRAQLTAYLAQNPYPAPEAIAELDRAFIAARLSPGGCADLLAATLFLYFGETERAR